MGGDLLTSTALTAEDIELPVSLPDESCVKWFGVEESSLFRRANFCKEGLCGWGWTFRLALTGHLLQVGLPAMGACR
jgi:hypothetical protein